MATTASDAGRALYDDLAAESTGDPAVTTSTMMGHPCLRVDGAFFAAIEPATGRLIVKLPRDRVAELVAAEIGQPFAPAGRVFREWVAVPGPDKDRWRSLLGEARAFVESG